MVVGLGITLPRERSSWTAPDHGATHMPHRIPKRAATTARVLVAAVSVAGLVAVSVLMARQAQPHQPPEPQPAPAPTPAQVAAMLHAAGLAPDALAAAGLTAAQAAAALERVNTQLPTLSTQFRAAAEAHAAARREHDRLERLVRSGTGTAQDLLALESARAQLQSAAAQRDAATQAFVSATELGPEFTARLATLHDPRGEGFPRHHRAAQRTDAQWQSLRYALASSTVHERLGLEVPAPARAVILASEAHPAVAAAAAGLSSNGAAVASAWNQALQLP